MMNRTRASAAMRRGDTPSAHTGDIARTQAKASIEESLEPAPVQAANDNGPNQDRHGASKKSRRAEFRQRYRF
jgi:hypothetical protein